MIDYKLAKKLKDAGFPQEGNGPIMDKEHYDEINKLSVFKTKNIEDVVYAPTLSELVEACGEELCILKNGKAFNLGDKWIIEDGFGKFITEGNTPEEAVALLYLKINKKK